MFIKAYFSETTCKRLVYYICGVQNSRLRFNLIDLNLQREPSRCDVAKSENFVNLTKCFDSFLDRVRCFVSQRIRLLLLLWPSL